MFREPWLKMLRMDSRECERVGPFSLYARATPDNFDREEPAGGFWSRGDKGRRRATVLADTMSELRRNPRPYRAPTPPGQVLRQRRRTSADQAHTLGVVPRISRNDTSGPRHSCHFSDRNLNLRNEVEHQTANHPVISSSMGRQCRRIANFKTGAGSRTCARANTT